MKHFIAFFLSTFLITSFSHGTEQLEKYISPNKNFSILKPKNWSVLELYDVGSSTVIFSTETINPHKLNNEIVIVDASVKIVISDIRNSRKNWSFDKLARQFIQEKQSYLEKKYPDLHVQTKKTKTNFKLNNLTGILTEDYHLEDSDNDISFYTRWNDKIVEINYSYLDNAKEKFMPTISKMTKSIKLLKPAKLKTQTYQNNSKTVSIKLPRDWHKFELKQDGINYFIISKNPINSISEIIRTGMVLIEIEQAQKYFGGKYRGEEIPIKRAEYVSKSINNSHLFFDYQIDKAKETVTYERAIKFNSGSLTHGIKQFRLINNTYYEILLKSQESDFNLYEATFKKALKSLRVKN